jgi:hypothetical protein
LAVGGDFPLQLNQILCTLVGIVQRLETDGADGNEQDDDGKKRHKQLGVDLYGYPRDKTRQQL